MKPIFDIHNKTSTELIALFENFPSTGRYGEKIVEISENLDYLKLLIPLTETTKNFMGIMYGGTMYSATDSIYVTMLWYRLGNDYFIIDKSSTVEYVRPGTSDLTAVFHLNDEEVSYITETLEIQKSVTREYEINIIDKNNKLVCKIRKIVYLRKRNENS